MSEFLADLQCRMLKWIAPGERDQGSVYEGKSKLLILLGEEILSRIRERTVIDFGCGEGLEALDLAGRGAKRVIGIDIREDVLSGARQKAISAGLEGVCQFATSTNERAHIIVSLDAFEHFGDPAGVLEMMDRLLLPNGEVIASFGPTWYHPLGGHLFSVFPWAHLLFSEQALIRWRSDLRSDGATRFSEVAGGLNQMTIRRFEKLVEASPFQIVRMELVPIRRLRYVHNRWTREFTTAIVRCRLAKRVAN